jgi:iron complex outermembrane receptor protein
MAGEANALHRPTDADRLFCTAFCSTGCSRVGMRVGKWLLVFLGAGVACVDAIAGSLDAVVVTATRIAEPADRIPADISVVSADELGARDATDMAAAMSLVPGVEAPPGGDAGPSSAVPSFWGLHEFDAFLLVVDGVPWGGAFNPAITTLNLTDIKSIEVMKGAAPVMYGATSFVGVVHAIHYPAGEAADEAGLAFGSYGSVRGSASSALPSADGYRQSFAVDGQKMGFADARESIDDGHVLYRGELDLGPGKLRVDADVSAVNDVPPSPTIRVGSGLTTLTPINANFNPVDAKIEENKYHVTVGYSQPAAAGVWETLISYAYSDIKDIRAFLEPDLSGAADTQNQRRRIDDGYLDTHVTRAFSTDTSLIVGGDLLYGRGRQTTLNGNGAYVAPLDGSFLPPPTTELPVNEIGTVNDKRIFAGQYAQVDWKPDNRWDVLAGVRLNEAYEHKDSSDLTLPPPELLAASIHKTMIRPSQTVGVSYRLWASGKDQAVVYADFRNAFKPSAIDFGPDYTPDLLSPETAQSYEAGVKGAAADGRFSYQGELFVMDFNNLVVPTNSGALANAAAERLKGVELETRYRMTRDVEIAVNASYHDARFRQYLFFDGDAGVDVGGRQLPLSPHVLASAGLLYTPDSGFGTTLVGRYVGRRFLDEENTAPVGGYTVFDATLEYRAHRYRVTLEGTNLTNRRVPVSASEFGSESFYLLPARMLWIRIGYDWR